MYLFIHWLFVSSLLDRFLACLVAHELVCVFVMHVTSVFMCSLWFVSTLGGQFAHPSPSCSWSIVCLLRFLCCVSVVFVLCFFFLYWLIRSERYSNRNYNRNITGTITGTNNVMHFTLAYKYILSFTTLYDVTYIF